jgi:hypothetical protein
MSHYARVNALGIVEQVIVAEQEFIDSLPDSSSWVQTSYNTHGGVHPENRPLRKNFAGIGFKYDPEKDAFIPPKPFNDWILNNYSCLWDAPIPMPNDGFQYKWDENLHQWIIKEE